MTFCDPCLLPSRPLRRFDLFVVLVEGLLITNKINKKRKSNQTTEEYTSEFFTARTKRSIQCGERSSALSRESIENKPSMSLLILLYVSLISIQIEVCASHRKEPAFLIQRYLFLIVGRSVYNSSCVVSSKVLVDHYSLPPVGGARLTCPLFQRGTNHHDRKCERERGGLSRSKRIQI